MINSRRYDLQYFADGAGSAAAAAAGSGEGAGIQAQQAELPRAGQTLADGTRVDARLADALRRQAEKHPERAVMAGNTPEAMKADTRDAAGKNAGQQGDGKGRAEKSIEDEWAELKKGRFAEQYGKDVQAAVQDRFKNQKDQTERLSRLEPMLKILMEQNGVESEEDLIDRITNDDSLYEDAAEEAGMTVEAYKTFSRLKAEAEENRRREAEAEEQRFFSEHLQKLAQQGEALKQRFPNFDLKTELQNETFRRMTSPSGGLSVEDAYFAVHHNELMPQMMAYGMQRAQQQISQTIRANGARAVEGAMQGQAAAAAGDAMPVRIYSREERQALIDRMRSTGEKIVL